MKWEAKGITHKGQSRIAVYFEKNEEAIKRIKLLPGARWSATLKAWHLPDEPAYRKQFGLEPATAATPVPIHHFNQNELQLFIELLQLKAYSPSTIKTYRNEFAQFIGYLQDKDVRASDPEMLRTYLLHCINNLKLSESTLHSRINACKFYFEQVLHKEKFFFEIPRPKKPMLLPKLLNEKELRALFNALTNKKHKAMLFTAYSANFA
jgi:integrase/recombinase XerD